MRKQINFFLDPISPFAYFACHHLLQLKQHFPVTVHCVPVLFAGLLSAHDNRGPAEVPPKRKYIFLDCVRNAKLQNMPFTLPPAHPYNPLLPLRALTAIDNQEQRFHLATTLTTACWGHGIDISKADNLVRIIDQSGLSGKDILQTASTEDVKGKLRSQTQRAIEQGVFGVPTMQIGNELFWGSDRIHHVEHFLRGELDVDYDHFEAMLDKPRGADRKEFIKSSQNRTK